MLQFSKYHNLYRVCRVLKILCVLQGARTNPSLRYYAIRHFSVDFHRFPSEVAHFKPSRMQLTSNRLKLWRPRTIRFRRHLWTRAQLRGPWRRQWRHPEYLKVTKVVLSEALPARSVAIAGGGGDISGTVHGSIVTVSPILASSFLVSFNVYALRVAGAELFPESSRSEDPRVHLALRSKGPECRVNRVKVKRKGDGSGSVRGKCVVGGCQFRGSDRVVLECDSSLARSRRKVRWKWKRNWRCALRNCPRRRMTLRRARNRAPA